MKLINAHIHELKTLCETHNVAELYVFGSVAKEEYTEESDMDFLVKFKGMNPLDYFDNYMSFKENLKVLFSREIDLLEIQTLKNPILKQSIDRDKIMVYGRKDSKMVV